MSLLGGRMAVFELGAFFFKPLKACFEACQTAILVSSAENVGIFLITAYAGFCDYNSFLTSPGASDKDIIFGDVSLCM
jgi:hypothetical protein